MKLRHWILFCMLVWGAQAATYYIDYDGGSDSNDGLTTGTAFQHGPFMKSATGNSASARGNNNTYIYKGGVTWTVTNFQMLITRSNTVHRSDESWYSGGSYARPVFDFQRTIVIDASGQSNNYRAAGILLSGVGSTNVSGTLLADLELKEYRGRRNNGTGDDYTGTFAVCMRGGDSGQLNGITLSNLYIHDWMMSNPTVAGTDSGENGAIGSKDLTGSAPMQNLLVINCHLHTENETDKVGKAIDVFGTFFSNNVHHVAQSFMGSGTVVSNFFWNTGMPAADPDAHENTFYNQGISKVYNNVFSNFFSAGAYDNSGCFRTGSSTHYDTNTGAGCTIYRNNIFIANSGAFGAPLDMDFQNLSGGTPAGVTNTAVIAINNIFVRPANNLPAINCSSQVQRPGQKLGLLWLANNHVINLNGSSVVQLFTDSVIEPIISFNQLTQTVATASSYGYTLANLYAPTSAAVPTYRTGSPLPGAPFLVLTDIVGNARNDPPDIGAWEYTVAPPVAGLTWTVPNAIVGQTIILKP